MGKKNKNRKANGKVAQLYSNKQYRKDISEGIEVLTGGIHMLVKNFKLLSVTFGLLKENTTITEEVRQDYLNTMVVMVETTNTSIDRLEALLTEALDITPEHNVRNNQLVLTWSLKIQSEVMEICGWLPDVAPIYMTMLDDLNVANKVELALPVLKNEEISNV